MVRKKFWLVNKPLNTYYRWRESVVLIFSFSRYRGYIYDTMSLRTSKLENFSLKILKKTLEHDVFSLSSSRSLLFLSLSSVSDACVIEDVSAKRNILLSRNISRIPLHPCPVYTFIRARL